MQAVLPVAPQFVPPQAPASAQLLPQGAAVSQIVPTLPQFDAVMTKAMMGLTQSEPTAPSVPQDVAIAQAAVLPPAMPTAPLTPGSQPPQLDPTATIAATTVAAPVQTAAAATPVPTLVATTAPEEQAAPVPTPAAPVPGVAIEPAIIATVLAEIPDVIPVKPQDGARIDFADRQPAGRLPRREATEAAADTPLPPPSVQAVIDPSVMLAIAAAPVAAPQADASAPLTTPPVAELPASLAKAVPDPPGKRDAHVKLPAAEVNPAAAHPVLSDASEPVIHDPTGAPASPPPVQAASPAAPTLPTSPLPASPLPTPVLPADAPQQAAPSGAAAAPVSPQVHAVSSPAAQIAPVLVSMAHAPDGAQRLTLRLDPPDLGHVQIRIDRPQDAPARVDITVERAETLTLLLRDQPQLQRALDQAGVPPDGRSVTIHVAATESAARPDGGPAASQGAGSAGTGDATYGTPRQGGQQARHETSSPGDVEGDVAQIVLPGWMRGGLDITA